MTELKEKKFKVTPCFTKAFCSKCNVELVMESVILPTYPCTYKYKCPKCGETFLAHNQYPTVGYTLGEEIIEDKISEPEEENKPTCDRNICLQNEYGNIGCEDCVVNKGENNETCNKC